MSHECLCRHHAKLVIPLLISLKHDGHHLPLPLNQIKVELLAKLKSCNLIIENSNILVFLIIITELVSHDIRLMAECDASEEFH